MNYSGVNNGQFIIMPCGTESAAVQAHETSFIGPYLGDLHLNHRGGENGSEVVIFFLNPRTGFHLKPHASG